MFKDNEDFDDENLEEDYDSYDDDYDYDEEDEFDDCDQLDEYKEYENKEDDFNQDADISYSEYLKQFRTELSKEIDVDAAAEDDFYENYPIGRKKNSVSRHLKK